MSKIPEDELNRCYVSMTSRVIPIHSHHLNDKMKLLLDNITLVRNAIKPFLSDVQKVHDALLINSSWESIAPMYNPLRKHVGSLLHTVREMGDLFNSIYEDLDDLGLSHIKQLMKDDICDSQIVVSDMRRLTDTLNDLWDGLEMEKIKNITPNPK